MFCSESPNKQTKYCSRVEECQKFIHVSKTYLNRFGLWFGDCLSETTHANSKQMKTK